ncbi:hypothetical protein UT300003_32990 [Clostridium sardiniense]
MDKGNKVASNDLNLEQSTGEIKRPKVPVGLSFSGEDGYEALKILNNRKGYTKSALVVDLLLLYKKAQEVLGTEDTIPKLRIELDKIQKKGEI